MFFYARRSMCPGDRCGVGVDWKMSRLHLWRFFLSAVLWGAAVPFVLADEFVPRGDVFQPLFADPKEIRSMVNIYDVVKGPSHTTVAAVGFADHWGLLRWEGKRSNDEWQLSVVGGVFAQFDMKTPSCDLVSADYLVGLPLSWKRGRTSARLRVYHQSSHLGDEYMLAKHPNRINLSYESLECIASREVGRLRAYGGGEYLFDHNPDEIKPWIGHVGLEARTAMHCEKKFDNSSYGTCGIISTDVKIPLGASEGSGLTFKIGVEFRPSDPDAHAARGWGITCEYYEGFSPYSQYFDKNIRYVGGGFQLGP